MGPRSFQEVAMAVSRGRCARQLCLAFVLDANVKRLAHSALRIQTTRRYGTKSSSSSDSKRQQRSWSPDRRFGSAAITLAGLGIGISTLHAASADERRPLADATWSELARRYFVYLCCSSSHLVDWSPSIIDACRSSAVPGVTSIFESFMKHTFFSQFVGGELIEDCMATVQRASHSSIGSILCFSAEAKPESLDSSRDASSHQDAAAHAPRDDEESLQTPSHLYVDRLEEMLHSIRVAGTYSEEQRLAHVHLHRNDSVLVAIKLSGLLRDPTVLERASACIMPREEWVSPPGTMPPTDKVAIGACPGLMIPTSALRDDDVCALKALWTAMQTMATCARDHGHVRLLLDAEYSWYQPAIDAVFESCAQQFNRAPPAPSTSWWPWNGSRQKDKEGASPALPLIYNTYQAYLRRTPAYLSMSLERARRGGYSLGIKLVRGAYVEIENSLWNTTVVDTPPAMPHDKTEPATIDDANKIPAQWKSPVWPSKRLTDECYDACVARIMDEIKADMVKHGARHAANVAVVFAGHNWDSSIGVIEHMLRLRLAHKPRASSEDDAMKMLGYRGLLLADGVRGRIHLGQLFGMADDLTHTVRVAFNPQSGGDGPHVVLKYIPYGNLSLTMPYLTRRAQENKSVMGAGRATRERTLVVAEVGHRLRAWLPWTTAKA